MEKENNESKATKRPKYKYVVKMPINSKQLDKLYEMLDKEVIPFDARLACDQLGHRWVEIFSRKSYQKQFRSLLAKAMK